MMASVYNVDALFTLADQLAAEDDFANVSKIESSLQHGMSSITDAELKNAVKIQIRDMGTIHEAQEKIGPMLEKLKRSPDDPAINAAVGKYACFERGQWEKGLPLLAKSNDPALKTLATTELNKPTEPEAIAALGDGWFDEAGKLPASNRPKILEHAASLYRIADANLSGLRKLAVEKRLAQIPSSGRLRRIDLLELFDPATSVVNGVWRMQDPHWLLSRERSGERNLLTNRRKNTTFSFPSPWSALRMPSLKSARGMAINSSINLVDGRTVWQPSNLWTASEERTTNLESAKTIGSPAVSTTFR